MKSDVSQRWVLSFADLTLVLLAFFVMMQAQVGDRLKVAAGIRDAFGGPGKQGEAASTIHGITAAAVFEDGEAILKPAEAARLKALGMKAIRTGKHVLVASQGRDGQSARLDSWELAAARTTAVARAVRMGGLPDAMIEIAIPPMRAGDPVDGQRISIELLSRVR